MFEVFLFCFANEHFDVLYITSFWFSIHSLVFVFVSLIVLHFLNINAKGCAKVSCISIVVLAIVFVHKKFFHLIFVDLMPTSVAVLSVPFIQRRLEERTIVLSY